MLVASGRVLRVLGNARALARCARASGARVLDLGDCVLAPGFVDAHAHLELTGLAGRLAGRGTFAAWIRALVAERARLPGKAFAAAVLAGADALVAGGTTCVGDIDSSGSSERALRRHPLRAVVFREALDAGDARRAAAALARASRPSSRSERRAIGVSPHAPYTVSRELLGSLAALAERRRWPVAIHWAETDEEVEWLEEGRGPFRDLLRASEVPRASGLDAIEAAGLLGPRVALVHGNRPARGDRARVARSGASLVHCPGTHAFFGRDPFPLRAWLDAGVPVALGTDGLSSNADLDMRREMALLRRAHPSIDPETVFDLATRGGARALGLEGRVGEIVPGAWADLAAHRIEESASSGAPAILDAITAGRSNVAGVWIAGRRVGRPLDFPRGTSESPRPDAE